MINLILSILFSTGIYIVFGCLKKRELPALPSILVNYFTAAVLGYIFSFRKSPGLEFLDAPWIFLSAGMGLLFVSVFFVVGKTAQSNGMTVATVASKMSMVIPIAYTLIFIGEPLTYLKLAGLFVALLAVLLTSIKADGGQNKLSEIYLPLIVFVGSGIVDVAIKYAEHHYYNQELFHFFTPTVFFFAGLCGTIGTLFLNYRIITKIKIESVAFGIILGTTNYFSLVYIIKAMADDSLSSSILFPANNLGIVCLTAITGFLVFKEKLSKLNLVGLVLAVFAVVLIGLL